MQTALPNAASKVGSGALNCQQDSCSGPAGSYSCNATGCTIVPGTYTEIRLTSKARGTALPGVYVVTDTIDLIGESKLTGTNVTFIVDTTASPGANILSANSGSEVNLTASTVNSAPNDTIPGIAFASRANSAMTFLCYSNLPFIGVFYMPNGVITNRAIK